MITAPHILDVSFPLNHEGAAMGAHIRQTVRPSLLIDGEQQRLIETTLEQRKRTHVTGRLHLRRRTDELPGTRENLFLGALVPNWIAINIAGQCFCPRYVRIYLEILLNHRI